MNEDKPRLSVAFMEWAPLPYQVYRPVDGAVVASFRNEHDAQWYTEQVSRARRSV